MIKPHKRSPKITSDSYSVSRIPLNYPLDSDMNFDNELLQSNLHPDDKFLQPKYDKNGRRVVKNKLNASNLSLPKHILVSNVDPNHAVTPLESDRNIKPVSIWASVSGKLADIRIYIPIL